MRLTPLVALILSSPLHGQEQDRLTLGNGDLFIGEVVSLNDGIIQIQSPHSQAPLQILNTKLVELSFANKEGAAGDASLPKNSQEIILNNGDRFPGELISLNEDEVTFQTWFTGDLPIQRHQITAIQFGVTPQKSIYRGPGEISEWEMENNRNWNLQDGKLQARQRSTIGKSLDLPENFIFKSRISWENTPNCRVHLCAEKATIEDSKPGNSYLVSLGSSGVQLQRILINEDGEAVYQQLMNNSVSLRSKGSKQVDLQLRVNRSTRMIHLYLDGVKVEQGVDPNPTPKGKSIIFESLNHGNGDLTVEDIAVDAWDAMTQNLRLEPRASDDLDTLSVDDGDRFSGQITAYDPTESNESFSIKTSLSPEPVSIPLQHCAIMYFAQEEVKPASEGQYKINLRMGGTLTVSKIKLGPNTLTATHPWLGVLQIDRRVMQSITKG